MEKALGPSGIDGLQADAHGIGTQAVDVALQVGVCVEGVSGSGMLEDAEFDSSLLSELPRLVDGERVAQVDVIVVDGKGRPGRRGVCLWGCEISTLRKRKEWGSPVIRPIGAAIAAALTMDASRNVLRE